MNTAEKARAYDEALERAKKFHTPDSNNSNLKAVLELIFPQLKESEDERIKKNILTKMRACQKQSNFFSNDEITWLENQKESLHIPEMCKENSDSFTDKDERIRTRLLEYFHGFKYSAECPVFWEGLNIDNILAWLEKQKEPHLRHSWKPSEEQMEKKSGVKEEPEYYQHFDQDC